MAAIETKSPRNYRNYCCVCPNYRGKVVDGNNITLHRFPVDKTLQKSWLKRIRTVSPQFKYSVNDRLCSAHFPNFKYDKNTEAARVPSVFILENGKTKTYENRKSSKEELVSAPKEMIFSTTVDMQDSEADDQEIQHNMVCTDSIQDSVMMHDYFGCVEMNNISKFINKYEQTDSVLTRSIQTQTHIFVEKKDVATNTDDLYVRVAEPQKTFVSVGTQVKKPDIVFEDIRTSDQKMMFYTGLPNAATFNLLFDQMSDADQHTHRVGQGVNKGRPRILSLVEEFFLVLMRLRLGLLLEDLSDRFHISKSTCSSITRYWITYLSVKLSFLISWPTQSTIYSTMSNKFRAEYPRCRIIIDCTEIYTETPQSLSNKSLMFSHYKSHMTYKALLGLSPAGVITFASDLWAGSISDKQLTKKCGLLDLFESGDGIMADKGFLISDMTSPLGIDLIIPPFKTKRFSKRQVEETRRIANLRINVERAMERVKNFRILQGVMPITLAQQATKIWKICVCLSNLLPPLVTNDDY